MLSHSNAINKALMIKNTPDDLRGVLSVKHLFTSA